MTKILIVDDNPQNCYMLEVLLKGNGHEVVSATNGAEALEKARRDPPAVIISDILMPVMDGFTLCRQWKEDEVLKAIPFVFYTATYTDARDEELALDLGAERFIRKPVEPDVFVGMLREVIKEAEEGRLIAPRKPVEEETVYLKEYSERLVKKLEDKMVRLEEVNRALELEITERKRAEGELQRLYEQAQRDAKTKATLLQEANHRVRNNLVAITGLLQVEQSYAKMEDQATYEAILQNLATRIGGMAKVHSLLSASEWAPVRLSDVAGQVIKSAKQICPRPKQVFIDAPPSPVRVTPRQANSLALVITELATNTIKHALAEREAVRIGVRIALEDDVIVLEIRDDGPGYPEDVLQLERHRVGFDLIRSLVSHDLRGELSLHNDDGAVTTIRFKREVAADEKASE